MSNRRTWILMLNTMFKNGKIMISDKCTMLIKELETHYYKENGQKDWEVNKVWDDLIDALRYLIFMIKKNSNNQSKFFLDKFKQEYKTNKSNFRKL
jgi:hypothetical protein